MSGLWLAVVCMFIYIIGIPAVMFFVLFSNRKAIKDTSSVKHASIKKRFGTLFRMYEPKYYYWEIVETVMKGFMTGALVVQNRTLIQDIKHLKLKPNIKQMLATNAT